MSITNSELIEQYKHLHQSGKYGQSARSAAASIKLCVEELAPKSILEYGCGQSELHRAFASDSLVFDRYDPAIPALSTIPHPSYDLVINTDVLEHIPEEDIDSVLNHFRTLSPHIFLRICTRPARTILPNGENAHRTVWSKDKWLAKIHTLYPEAVMPFFIEEETCLILSWPSRVAAQITKIETDFDRRRRGKVRGFFKSIERGIRRMRDAVLGRKKSG